MAMFKPEVRTVEGSNVGTYNPPTVDYSGFYSGIGQSIASIIDTKGNGGNVSESDKKALALRDVTTNIQRAYEIEDTTVRAVTLKNIQKNAIMEYPQYREDVKGIFGEFTGEMYQGTGVDPDTLVMANTYKWATSTSEGQSAAATAQMKSGGDTVLMDQYIKDSYLQDLAYKNQVAAAEQESKLLEADDKKRKVLFGTTVRPLLQNKVDTAYAQDTSDAVVKRITQEATSQGLDVPTVVLDALTTTRNQRLAEVTNEINRMGLDPTTVNPESFMAGYDASIKTLTQNRDLLVRSMKNMTDDQKVRAVMNIASPFVREAAMSGNPIFLQEHLTLDPIAKNDMKNLGQYALGSAGGPMAPSVFKSNLSSGTVGDSPAAFASQYDGLAPREELEKIFKAPQEAKRSLIKMGYDSIKSYKFDKDVPEKTEAAHRNISGMYVASLPEIDIEGEGTKSKNVRALMGDRAFNTIEAIKTSNPELGNDLYNKMNTYSINAVKRLIDSFNTNMDVIKDTENAPFVLEMDKNGNLGLNVNSEALQNDVNLKKAMGAYRYETRGTGRGAQQVGVDIAPVETDPMKILSNYVSITEGANQKEVIDLIDSLKIISMQSRNIPIEIRNRGYDPIEIIKQNVTVLGK